ncbi:HNH endonuclease signature motif containing protein [Nocardia sp. CDC160]|uniref:HNH endonuclease signature motif containing protein n=1 Tax=Nocardia sp. CDC160 TaxID=3112166 RepID=UPI002DB64961|nr:DUF222 domain-containing protein [Nocardia sp. CDC160]MEC3920040.1 DUF222 domain-containing protein [Nocardia sp. CDC160]
MTGIADDVLFATEVVEELRAVHSEIAALQAKEVELMTLLYQVRRAEQLDLGVGELYAGEDAATEIGIALKVSQRSADGLIGLGLGLENRYPHTREAFAAGRIDLSQVRAISDTLTNAPEDMLAELEPRLADYAEKSEPQRIRRTGRRWMLESDPEGQALRRKEAEAERFVSVRAADNGTTELDGVLTAHGGRTLYERLREMAVTECCGNDPRTMNQRRADALVALADGSGRLICQCGNPDCPRLPTEPVPTPRKTLVQVGVSAETLAGLQDNPALLSGFGAIDADLARQLARLAKIDLIPENPTAEMTSESTGKSFVSTGRTSNATGQPSTAEHRYRPSARLTARVRALDGTCRAPGCQVPAADTDLDHQDRFDHHNPTTGGPTTESNLGARCRRHHRLKTLADNGANRWQITHRPDRVVEWCTPSGDSTTTTPEGTPFLFPSVPVPPVTAAGVPDVQPTGSLLDPGPLVNELMDLVQAYCTPSQRRAHRRARHNM